MKYLVLLFFLIVTGCTVSLHVPPSDLSYDPQPMSPEYVYEEPEPESVVSIYIEPPEEQPPPVAVRWAPPPMLVMTPPPQPYPDAVWIGGYWVWEGDWVWAYGRWADPPRPRYRWVQPYYENRNGLVLFVNGYWAAPHVEFIPPPVNIRISISEPRTGVRFGARPIGPDGPFVPPPPGSRRGIIVPAPIGTAPAVVTGAQPVINSGMYIDRRTTINNVTNVTIIAPATATANRRAYNNSVPYQSHLAAGQRPIVRTEAPRPASTKPLPAYVPGRSHSELPPPQIVNPVIPPELRDKRRDRNLDQKRQEQDLRKRDDDRQRRDLEQQRKNQEIRQREDAGRRDAEAGRQRDLEQKRKEQEIRQREEIDRRERRCCPQT